MAILKWSVSVSSSCRICAVLCSDACVSGNFFAPVIGLIWPEVFLWRSCGVTVVWKGSDYYLRAIGILSVFKVCTFLKLYISCCTVPTEIVESCGAQGVILLQLLTCFASCYPSCGASFLSNKYDVFLCVYMQVDMCIVYIPEHQTGQII